MVFLMHDAKRFIAVGNSRHDNADADEVIDFIYIHIMFLQFLKKAIEMFGASKNSDNSDAFFE